MSHISQSASKADVVGGPLATNSSGMNPPRDTLSRELSAKGAQFKPGFSHAFLGKDELTNTGALTFNNSTSRMSLAGDQDEDAPEVKSPKSGDTETDMVTQALNPVKKALKKFVVAGDGRGEEIEQTYE